MMVTNMLGGVRMILNRPQIIGIALTICCLVTFISCSKAPQVQNVPRPSEQHRLAPPGVLYLIEGISVTTNEGVTGLWPGTRFHVIEDRGETIVVTNGATNLAVPADKLTNDLDIAELASRRDAKAQRDLANYLVEQRRIDEASREKQGEVFDQRQREASARRTAAAVARKGSNPLERGAYNEKRAVYGRPYIYYP